MKTIIDDSEDLNRIAGNLIQDAIEAGLNQAARLLADALPGLGDDDEGDFTQHYVDGFEDALLTLIKAGATDPR